MRCQALIALSFIATPALSLAQPDAAIRTIGLGSCLKEDKPAPALQEAAALNTDLFIFLGDNIYGDSDDMSEFARKYATLAEQPGLKALRASKTKVLATWDDHDYGNNDLGANYPHKRGTQKLFCDFWSVPADSPRRTRDGVYDSVVFGPGPTEGVPGRRVQVILLDTRFNRSDLRRRTTPGMSKDEVAAIKVTEKSAADAGYPGAYVPLDTPAAEQTVLGEAQWAWLREQLLVPAEIRLIATSYQFVSEEHRYENWANLPAERVRFVRLLNETKADGVLLASGDRHWSELSCLKPGMMTLTPPTFEKPEPVLAGAELQPRYPLWEITSSGLNRPRSPGSSERNMHRVGKPYLPPSFGLMTIDWAARDASGQASPTIRLESRDERGTLIFAQRVRLADLRGQP